MRSDPAGWTLYFIPEAGGKLPLPVQAALGLEGGARVVQLRLKGAGEEEWLRTGRELLGVCRRFGRPLIVNDRPDIAGRLGADGVHLGQQDLPPGAARRLLGKESVIGVSVTRPEEARRARDEGADYLAVGPVFASLVKGEIDPVGLHAVSQVRESVHLPIIGIGGITAENAALVLEAGADGVAVITSISRADDPRSAAALLSTTVEDTLAQRRKHQ